MPDTDRKLIFIGGIHSDPQGESRLVRAIERFDPSHFTLERREDYNVKFRRLADQVAQLAWGNRKKLKVSYEQAMQAKENILCYGYEGRVAEKYEKGDRPVVYYVDDGVKVVGRGRATDRSEEETLPDVVKKYRKHFQDVGLFLFHQKKGTKFDVDLGTSTVVDAIARAFLTQEEDRALIEWFYNRERSAREGDPDVVRRDEIMERRIRRIWESTEGDLLHEGGLHHIFGAYHNLYDRLADLNPMRYKLNEF